MQPFFDTNESNKTQKLSQIIITRISTRIQMRNFTIWERWNQKKKTRKKDIKNQGKMRKKNMARKKKPSIVQWKTKAALKQQWGPCKLKIAHENNCKNLLTKTNDAFYILRTLEPSRRRSEKRYQQSQKKSTKPAPRKKKNPLQSWKLKLFFQPTMTAV